MAKTPRKLSPLRLLAFGLLILGLILAAPTSVGVFNTKSESFTLMLALFIIGVICFIVGIILLVVTPKSRM